MVIVRNSSSTPSVPEAVLFPFDNHSIPFSAGLRLQLVSGKSRDTANPIVLKKGGPGEPDDLHLRLYGTVIKVGDTLYLWYQARGTLDPAEGPDYQFRVCLATSKDGVRWEKPKLGLVEFNGSRENNIVDIFGGRCVVWSGPVLHDPEDPDPARRFKMVIESGVLYDNRMAVAYSPDGVRWTEPPNNPVGPYVAHSGVVRYDGCYYVTGQDWDRTHPGRTRKLVVYASYDWEHWTDAAGLGMRRDIAPRQVSPERNANEEIHRGAGLWNRGNVIVGVCDLIHGHPTGAYDKITMDIGLAVSNDGLHFREPVPDFRLIPAYDEIDVAPGKGPFIKQTQAMTNVDEHTMCWYESWHGGGLRLALWPRDRLGFFESYYQSGRPGLTVSDPAHMPDTRPTPYYPPGDPSRPTPHFISCPINGEGKPLQVFVNADASVDSPVIVELLDLQFRPIQGHSGNDSIPVTQSALRGNVRWDGSDAIAGVGGDFRVKVSFGGTRPELARLYAVYLKSGA